MSGVSSSIASCSCRLLPRLSPNPTEPPPVTGVTIWEASEGVRRGPIPLNTESSGRESIFVLIIEIYFYFRITKIWKRALPKYPGVSIWTTSSSLMSGIDMLDISIVDVEAISRLLTPGVTIIWLLDVSAKLVSGGGISFGAPVTKRNCTGKKVTIIEIADAYQGKLELH